MLALGLLLATFTVKAQLANGGFEQWDSINNGVFTNHVARGWADYLNSFCEAENLPWSVTQSSDAHSGLFALQLKNIATTINQTGMLLSNSGNPEVGMNNKIPVNARYPKFEGYYKYSTQETDTFSVMVMMYKGEEYIGAGYYQQSVNTTNYTKFSFPLLYSAAAGVIPDSAVVYITAGSSENVRQGSTLLIDDLAFAYSTGLNDNQGNLEADVNLFPNPTTDFINVTIKGATHGNVNVQLLNVIGQTIKTETLSSQSSTIAYKLNLTDVPNGVFFVHVSDQSGAKTYRIVKH